MQQKGLLDCAYPHWSPTCQLYRLCVGGAASFLHRPPSPFATSRAAAWYRTCDCMQRYPQPSCLAFQALHCGCCATPAAARCCCPPASPWGRCLWRMRARTCGASTWTIRWVQCHPAHSKGPLTSGQWGDLGECQGLALWGRTVWVCSCVTLHQHPGGTAKPCKVYEEGMR
jgi:hypothetical protein